MPNADDMLTHAADHAGELAAPGLSARPGRKVAVLSCMDTRIDLFPMLGLRRGDAHIIRNAGGLATDDVIRSLIVSQQLLGTHEIVVIGHTGCGLIGADEDALRGRMASETGETLDIAFGSFDDLDASVQASVARLRTHAWLKRVPVHGLVFDVATGRLREVTPA